MKGHDPEVTIPDKSLENFMPRDYLDRRLVNILKRCNGANVDTLNHFRAGIFKAEAVGRDAEKERVIGLLRLSGLNSTVIINKLYPEEKIK